jgi:hypothetical protein
MSAARRNIVRQTRRRTAQIEPIDGLRRRFQTYFNDRVEVAEHGFGMKAAWLQTVLNQVCA